MQATANNSSDVYSYFNVSMESSQENVTFSTDSNFTQECKSLLATIGQGHVTDPLSAQVLVALVLSLITLATFTNNMVVLVALTLGRGRPTTFSLSLTLVTSMLTADILLSVIVLPISMYNIVGESWIMGKAVCRFHMAIDILLCTTSILHLTGLSFDRYLAICRPFLHIRVTKLWARALCVTLWFMAFLLAFPVLVPDWHHQGVDNVLAAQCVLELYESGRTCVWLTSPLYQSVVITLSFFLPLILIIGFHVPICYAVRRQQSKLQALAPASSFCSFRGGGDSPGGSPRMARGRTCSIRTYSGYRTDREFGDFRNGKLRSRNSISWGSLSRRRRRETMESERRDQEQGLGGNSGSDKGIVTEGSGLGLGFGFGFRARSSTEGSSSIRRHPSRTNQRSRSWREAKRTPSDRSLDRRGGLTGLESGLGQLRYSGHVRASLQRKPPVVRDLGIIAGLEEEHRDSSRASKQQCRLRRVKQLTSVARNTDCAAAWTEHSQDVDTEHSQTVDTEHSQTVDTEHSQTVDTEHSQSVDTEHSQTVDTEHSQTVDTEHSQTVDTKHSQTVDTEHSQTADSEHNQTAHPKNAQQELFAQQEVGTAVEKNIHRTSTGLFSHQALDHRTSTGLFSQQSLDHQTSTGQFSHQALDHRTSTGLFSQQSLDHRTSTGQFSHQALDHQTSTGQFSQQALDHRTSTGQFSQQSLDHRTSTGQFSHQALDHRTSTRQFSQQALDHRTSTGQFSQQTLDHGGNRSDNGHERNVSGTRHAGQEIILAPNFEHNGNTLRQAKGSFPFVPSTEPVWGDCLGPADVCLECAYWTKYPDTTHNPVVCLECVYWKKYPHTRKRPPRLNSVVAGLDDDDTTGVFTLKRSKCKLKNFHSLSVDETRSDAITATLDHHQNMSETHSRRKRHTLHTLSLNKIKAEIAGSDVRVTGSDSKPTESDVNVTGSDSKPTGSDVNVTGSDSKHTGSGSYTTEKDTVMPGYDSAVERCDRARQLDADGDQCAVTTTIGNVSSFVNQKSKPPTGDGYPRAYISATSRRDNWRRSAGKHHALQYLELLSASDSQLQTYSEDTAETDIGESINVNSVEYRSEERNMHLQRDPSNRLQSSLYVSQAVNSVEYRKEVVCWLPHSSSSSTLSSCCPHEEGRMHFQSDPSNVLQSSSSSVNQTQAPSTSAQAPLPRPAVPTTRGNDDCTESRTKNKANNSPSTSPSVKERRVPCMGVNSRLYCEPEKDVGKQSDCEPRKGVSKQSDSEPKKEVSMQSENSPRKHSENSPRTHSENSARNHSENSPRNHSENSPRTHSENSPRNHSENSPRNHSENSPRKHSENSSRTHKHCDDNAPIPSGERETEQSYTENVQTPPPRKGNKYQIEPFEDSPPKLVDNDFHQHPQRLFGPPKLFDNNFHQHHKHSFGPQEGTDRDSLNTVSDTCSKPTLPWKPNGNVIKRCWDRVKQKRQEKRDREIYPRIARRSLRGLFANRSYQVNSRYHGKSPSQRHSPLHHLHHLQPACASRKEDNKALITVLALVSSFVVCWVPLFTVLLVQSQGGYDVPLNVVTAFTWLGYVNSAINPVLYYKCNRSIRLAVRRLLCKHLAPVDQPFLRC